MDNNSLSREQLEAIRRIREREVRKGGIVERKSTKMTKQTSPPTRKKFPFLWLILICVLGVILFILLNFFNGSILNQNKVITWEKTFGGSIFNGAESLIQTTEGGYALAGITYSYGAGEADFWVIKLDSDGNKEWEKTFGGSDDDRAWSLIQTTDGGYAVAGITYSYGAGMSNFYVIKLDEKGNLRQ